MKKLMLIPTILITGISPVLSMVSCNEEKEEDYDLIIIENDYVHVQDTKFKLNEELVIHYWIEGFYNLDPESTITIGTSVPQKIIDIASCSTTKIIIPAEKVIDSPITIDIKAIPYEPENYCIINQFDSSSRYSHKMNSAPFLIELNKPYYFQIDMNSWQGSKDPNYYKNTSIVINGSNYVKWKKQTFKIIVDDQVFDEDSYYYGSDVSGDWVYFNDEDRAKIFNATKIVGCVEIESCKDPAKQCFFMLYAYKR